jgi:hypothetical protein
MINDDDKLIGRYFNGTLSPEQKGALQELLAQSPQARQRFRLLATLEDGLAERAQEFASADIPTSPSSSALTETDRLLSWRPLAAAAAGLVIGALSATVLWAQSTSKVPTLERINVPLFDPGFEEINTPIPAVIPRVFDRWNGDASHAVSSGDSVVKPKQGEFMLKMLPVEDRKYSRIEQIVDVRHLVPAKGGRVTFSASIICDGAETQSKIILVLRSFNVDIRKVSGSTEKLQEQVTCETRKTVFIPADSTNWHIGELAMDLPEKTKTLVFEIAAVDLPKKSRESSRYIDDIKAEIVATLPNEIQQ